MQKHYHLNHCGFMGKEVQCRFIAHLTHWGQDNMPVILQTTFSNQSFFYDFLKFNNEIGQLKINQYWFVGTELATRVLDGKQFISYHHVVLLLQIHFYSRWVTQRQATKPWMPPCCEKFAQLEWRGAASVCACGSSRHMGPDLGHYSSRVALAREWCYKQSIYIICKATFADEIALFKIVDVANMWQSHWIRDKWFVLLDLLSSNKTFRAAFQVINEILPLYKMFFLFIWDIFLIYSRGQQHLLIFHDDRVLVW